MSETTGDMPGRPSTDEVLTDLTGPAATPATAATPGEDPRDNDEAGPSLLFSENEVIYLGSDEANERTALSVPDELLVRLAKAWKAGSDERVVAAVRDLFDGIDGQLQFLEDLGMGD